MSKKMSALAIKFNLGPLLVLIALAQSAGTALLSSGVYHYFLEAPGLVLEAPWRSTSCMLLKLWLLMQVQPRKGLEIYELFFCMLACFKMKQK